MLEILLYCGAFIILLGLSAFFSGSETAYFSLTDAAIDRVRSSGDINERRVAELLSQPQQLLITIVLGNTIVNITTASLAAILTHRLVVSTGLDNWQLWGINGQIIAIFMDVVLVTLVILITSEIIPKVVAIRNPQSFSRRTVFPLKMIYHFLYIFTYPLTRFTSLLQQSGKLTREKTLITEDELKILADMGEEHGSLMQDEKEMIHSIFEFGETTVKEIMVPRTDMITIEVSTSLTQLMELVKSKPLSRIPIYEKRIDNIVGILYIKDLLPLLSKRRRERLNLMKLVHKPYFVPEQKKIQDLLREFQRDRIHMALVVDEYGGISGLVTLEDIIEEIVGEIQDEYDREAPLYEKIDESTFLVNGRMSLEEINEELHLNLPTEEGVETISGFILHLLGALPKENDIARYNGYQFVVEKVAKNRILKVRIQKTQPDVNFENEYS